MTTTIDSLDLESRQPTRLLIAFIDFTRYTARAFKNDPMELASWIDDYYGRVWAAVEPTGGRVLKFFGDGGLLIFPIERADDAALALLDLKHDMDAWFGESGWDSRLNVKVHAGTAVLGPYGPDRRLDVIGPDVNIAATLATRGFALTAEAFRALSPDTRKRFKKHTPPVTYIRVEDRHPHRTGRRI